MPDQWQEGLDQLELLWIQQIGLDHTDEQFEQLLDLFDRIHQAMCDPEFWRK